MNTYIRAKMHDLGAAVQKLPNLNPETVPERAALRTTGTEDGCGSDAVPDAVTSGNGGGDLRVAEETDGSDDSEGESSEPLKNHSLEDNQGDLKTPESGEGGIL